MQHCSTVALPLLQVDPQVSASVYYAASLYYKQQKEYAQYYRCGWGRARMAGMQSAGVPERNGRLQAWSEACKPADVARCPVPPPSPHPSLCCRATLMYLAFVSQDTLPQDFRQVCNRCSTWEQES